MATFSDIFNINETSVPLNQGDKLIFKFVLNSTTTNNFTASFTSAGSLRVSSLASSTGYNNISCPFLDSASISAGTNEIVFSTSISSLHDNGYIFVPNPLTGSESSLYPSPASYGDVDYPFVAKTFDIIVLYLSDGTYIEYRVLNVYEDVNGLVHLTLDQELSVTIKDELVNGTYQRFLLLSRREDETNAYIIYQKRPGKTSYGFIIPQNLATDILDNIDVITREVKQKLINEQSAIDNISGGEF
jgi:hypothetical protein